MKIKTLDKIAVFLAELFGTGILLFMGCIGCINTWGHETSVFQVVFNFGLVVMICVTIFGCVSGAHLNPAVTLAAVIYKLITPTMGIIYFAAQMLGAFMGFGLLKLLTPENIFRPENSTGPGLCSTVPHPDLTASQALGIEFLCTAILILLCCGCWDPRNSQNTDCVPLKFGLAVAALASSFGPYTGASMNPARTFAPAIWNSDFTLHWIYWVGPLSASAIVSFAFKAVFWREVPEERNGKLAEEYPLQRDTHA